MTERGEPVPNRHDPATCPRCREAGTWPELRAATDDARRVARERADYGWRRVYGVDPAASAVDGVSVTVGPHPDAGRPGVAPGARLVRADWTPTTTGRIAAAHLDAWVRDQLATDFERLSPPEWRALDDRLPVLRNRPDRPDRPDRTDRGAEPTVTEPTSASTSELNPVAEAAAVAPAAPTPLRLTYEGLRDLGACGPYLGKFRDRFPQRTHPNGVELTLDTCREHWRSWDWTWASDVMLTEWGRNEYWRMVNSSTREARERFGTGEARRGAVLGYLLHHHPATRSPRLVEATTPNPERERQRADQAALSALDNARHDVGVARGNVERYERDIAHWRSELARREALLPTLEEAAAAPLLRRAERAAREAAERVVAVERDADQRRAILDRQVERARVHAEEVAAELTRLREVAATSTTSPAEPATGAQPATDAEVR